MTNNPQATDAFYKAQSLAYWSFCGLIIPLVGVILGAMSKSRLRLLSSGNPEEQSEIERTRRIASWGFGISLALLVIYVIAAITWGIIIGLAAGKSTNSTTGSNSSSSTHDITGSLSLHDTTTFSSMQNGDACEGSGGYSDITQGAQAVASDSNGTVLALSQLNAGQADGNGNCVFSFTIPSVPYSNFYKFQVSHRGELDYSYQQISANNFSISTTLGN